MTSTSTGTPTVGTTTNPAGTIYEIRVAGHLADHWSVRLAGLTITRNADGTSTLLGPVADQAQLHGALAGLRDIGATLLDLHAAPTGPSTDEASVLTRPLRTERLTLRPAIDADTDATWRFRQLVSINEWLTGCPADLDGYRTLFTDPTRLATTVIVELGHGLDAVVIGDLVLRRQDAWAQLDVADQARGTQAELGWVLDPKHVGHGYATEAIRELLRYCFEELGVRRVTANCFLADNASWKLMERMGMRRETHAVQESLHRSGAWLDTVAYALLAVEWNAERPTS